MNRLIVLLAAAVIFSGLAAQSTNAGLDPGGNGSTACPTVYTPMSNCWDNTLGFWVRFWYNPYGRIQYVCRVGYPGSFQCI